MPNRSGRRPWRTWCTPKSSGCAGERKPRTRKSKARIDKAGQLMEELADLNTRTRSATAQIDFSATERKTKRLIELENVAYSFGDRRLFENLNFIIAAGMRVGLVGPNGSGKTTLLRLLRGELAPSVGEIRRADRLRIVYFDQNAHARSHANSAPRAGAGRRFGHLPGPRHSRRILGGALSVQGRATESACRAASPAASAPAS